MQQPAPNALMQLDCPQTFANDSNRKKLLIATTCSSWQDTNWAPTANAAAARVTREGVASGVNQKCCRLCRNVDQTRIRLQYWSRHRAQIGPYNTRRYTHTHAKVEPIERLVIGFMSVHWLQLLLKRLARIESQQGYLEQGDLLNFHSLWMQRTSERDRVKTSG